MWVEDVLFWDLCPETLSISPFLETSLKRTISCATCCMLKAAWTHSQRRTYTQPQRSGWQSCWLSWRKHEGSWALTALEEAAAACPLAPWGWPSTRPWTAAAERPHPSAQNHSCPPGGQRGSRLPARTRCPSPCPCCSSVPARLGPEGCILAGHRVSALPASPKAPGWGSRVKADPKGGHLGLGSPTALGQGHCRPSKRPQEHEFHSGSGLLKSSVLRELVSSMLEIDS